MELSFVKNFLRVDFDDDDAYIQLLIETAEEYITNAVGEFDTKNPLMRLLALTLISSLYDNRQYTVEKDSKTAYILRSMILQLQLAREE